MRSDRVRYHGGRNLPETLGLGGVSVVRFDSAEIIVKIDPRVSLAIRNHSPTGFNWGYEGSGPAQLALALLLDFLEADGTAAVECYQEFKRSIVASWQKDDWTISGAEIRTWLEDRFYENLHRTLAHPTEGGQV